MICCHGTHDNCGQTGRPRILLMDEGTSHLDMAKEHGINASLAQLAMTRIAIAHRPETIAAAKHDLRMRQGRLELDLRAFELAADRDGA